MGRWIHGRVGAWVYGALPPESRTWEHTYNFLERFTRERLMTFLGVTSLEHMGPWALSPRPLGPWPWGHGHLPTPDAIAWHFPMLNVRRGPMESATSQRPMPTDRDLQKALGDGQIAELLEFPEMVPAPREAVLHPNQCLQERHGTTSREAGAGPHRLGLKCPNPGIKENVI